MKMKVEINGINTSQLPVLAPDKQQAMLREIKNGKEELKEEFIKCNLRLVLSLVKRFNSRTDNVDDLFQVGVVGLIKAIDNFDISQNVQFSTYAVPMIVGEIKRFLRDSTSMRVSRSIRDISYKVAKAKEEYVSKNQEEPTVAYLAKTVNESEEDVILAMDSVVQPVSIYDAVFNDGGDAIYIIDQLKNDTNDAEKITEKISLAQALQKLSDKERLIIQKRYFDNLTQTELAKEIGVSQAQISRVEKLALARIKKKMMK